MFTVDAENIVYSTFLKEYRNDKNIKEKSITIEQIKNFTEMAQAIMSDCNFEASENSICSAVEFYSNIFEWRNNRISFVEQYEDEVNFDKLEAIFIKRLPNRVSKTLLIIAHTEY